MNKGIKAALALGLCCVTAAGLFGCGKAAPEETDFQEYQPEKKMPSLLNRFARKAEPDTTGEVTLDPEDEDDGREEE